MKPIAESPNPASNAFLKNISNPLRFRLYLFTRMPSAFFSGLRITRLDAGSCTVIVPYKWFTRNPFRSTYFACLAMAAEMSTGILAMSQLYGRSPRISMLVVGLEASYFKKATSSTHFQCTDGNAIRETIEKAIATGDGQTIRARSAGMNPAGDPIADFYITWSFKVKKS